MTSLPPASGMKPLDPSLQGKIRESCTLIEALILSIVHFFYLILYDRLNVCIIFLKRGSLCISLMLCVLIYMQYVVFVRLNREEGDGAWCPAGQLQPSDVQYLQLDLRQLFFLTVVATQGRYARNSGNEYARKYRLEYSRDGHRWIPWRNRFGSEVRITT